MWCRNNRKTSTIHEFSKKELKITSFLGLFSKGPFYSQEFSVALAMHALVSLYKVTGLPRGLGKGSDAALIGAWLESVMTPIEPSTLPDAWTQHNMHVASAGWLKVGCAY